MYGYLIVGVGLFGSVFAYEAKKRGKTCLVIDKRDHIGAISISKKSEKFMFISMVPTFFILQMRRFGSILINLQHLTGIPTSQLHAIKMKCTIGHLI